MSTAVDMVAREADLDQRIAILRRYRRMLELQRSHLQEYLALIDTRETAVRTGDVDKLENYTQLEQGVINLPHCWEIAQPFAGIGLHNESHHGIGGIKFCGALWRHATSAPRSTWRCRGLRFQSSRKVHFQRGR